MSKFRKRLIIISSSIIIFFFILGLSLNLILSSIATASISTQLQKVNSKGSVIISVDKIKVNVFSSTLIIKGISIAPNNEDLASLANGESHKPFLIDYSIPDIRIRGFSVYNILFNKELEINKILIKGLDIIVYKTKKFKAELDEIDDGKALNLDSLRFPFLKALSLKKIEIATYAIKIVDLDKADTSFKYSGDKVELNGFRIEEIHGTEGLFELKTNNLRLKMNRQRFDLPGNNYFIFFDKLDYVFADSSLQLKDFKLNPVKKKEKLAESFKYAQEVYNIDAEKFNVEGIRVGDFINKGILEIDSVILSGFTIQMYKDKSKPWNFDKRPLFPQQSLKKMEQDINIGVVIVKNSSLKYIELPPKSKIPMVVDISDINANITGITSIDDSINAGKNLSVKMKARLMNAANMEVNIIMPIRSAVDTFYFSGNLGSAPLNKFNNALYPATGIKMEQGNLNGIRFAVKASPKRASGNMTMLYDGLVAEVTKVDVEEKDKTLSWIANAVLPKSNPSKNGKTKVAIIEFTRAAHKGLGNLLWKSVQSGLINTISPVGKKSFLKRKKNRKR